MKSYAQCQEYVGYLGVQRTKKGEYLVRDLADRVLSRHKTLRDARKAAKAFIAEWRARQAAAERRWRSDKEFQRQHPDLLQRQIAWQQARDKAYQALKDLEYEVAQLAKERAGLTAQIARGKAVLTAMGRLEKVQMEEARLRSILEQFAALYYGEVTELDTRLKAAWQAHDAQEIASLLNHTDAVLRHTNKMRW